MCQALSALPCSERRAKNDATLIGHLSAPLHKHQLNAITDTRLSWALPTHSRRGVFVIPPELAWRT